MLGFAKLLLQHGFGGIIRRHANGDDDGEHRNRQNQQQPGLGIGQIKFQPFQKRKGHGRLPPYLRDNAIIQR
ncbi:hypothetical protein D1872_349190 [compost metagenome]